MYVEASLSTGSSTLREVEDLNRLSVTLDQPGNADQIDRALGDLGRPDGVDHAWLNIENLRRASGRADDPAWTERFDAMISFAGSRGWLTAEGDAVRAHVVSPTAPPEDL